jgi:autotransporter-associated beta strand protein
MILTISLKNVRLPKGDDVLKSALASMQKKISLTRTALALAFFLTTPTALHAQTYVWDGSTSSGYQNTNGTWGTDNFWTTNSGASSGTVLAGWTNTSGAAWFGGNSTTAATPSGNFTVTVSGTQTANTVRQIQSGVGNFTLTSGTLVLTGNGVRADRGTFTVNSVITNSAATLQLYAAGPGGLLILGGNNTYTATSDIRGAAGGTVRLNNAGALGTGSSVQFSIGSVLLDLNGFNFSGKTISITAGQTGFLGNTAATKSIWSGNVTLTNTGGILRAGGTNAEVEISGIISGSTGSLQSFDGGTLRLSGDNTYSGGTSVRDGSKLIVAHTNALGSLSATNTIQAATLDLNGFDIGNRIITLQDNASRLVNDNTGSAAVVSGAINMLTNRSNAQIGGDGNLTLRGSMTTQDGTGGGFTKVGAGTVTLTRTNTYSGATTVSQGTLLVDANGSIASSSLATVNNGGLLQVNGTAGAVTVNNGGSLGGSGNVGAFTLQSGAFLTPGNSPGTLNATSASLLAGSTYNWEIKNAAGGPSAAGTNWDLLNVTDELNLSTLNTTSNKLNLVLKSLDSDGLLTTSLSGFTIDTAYSWVFAQAGSINNSAFTVGADVTDYFYIDTTAFNNDVLPDNYFKVEVGTSGDLRTLNLMAIPEPSTGSMLGLGLAGLVVTRLLRRKNS